MPAERTILCFNFPSLTTKGRFSFCDDAPVADVKGGWGAEVAIVGDDNKFRVLTSAEVSDYLEEVE